MPEGPGMAGPKAPGSMLIWRCCSLLGHLCSGPFRDSFYCSTANKYNDKCQKGPGSQCQKPLGQCYLGSAVHYLAILAVAPTGILSVVALLTNKYDGKGQKSPGSQGKKPWVKAILVVLFIIKPNWQWPMLGFFL